MSTAFCLLIGFCLDLRFGDPRWLPHPVVAIGRAITALERVGRRTFPRTPRGKTIAGLCLVAVIVVAVFCIALAVTAAAWRLHPALGVAVESFICYQALATRGLMDAARNVYARLAAGDLTGARAAVAAIVGRDTEALDAQGIVRATVETVAENASDGVVAPMFYFALGGAPLALAYKAVNTMDSMLGYKNDRYRHFGTAAARLDDIANFIPARLTACAAIPAAMALGMDWPNAWRIYRRDARNHSSPNAGHPEAAWAGALGVRLGGDSRYSGVIVHKPHIGDAVRPLAVGDILLANRLLLVAAGIVLAACCGGALLWT